MNHLKNKVILILIVSFFVIVGSLAYWTQELYVKNEFKTPIYKCQIKEDFTAPLNWLPGHKVNKDVWVENDSDVPVLAKASIKQSWVRSENVYDANGEAISPLKGENIDLYFDTGSGVEPASLIEWGENVVILSNSEDAKINSRLRNSDNDENSIVCDVPVVYNLEDAENKWLILNEKPDDEGYINIIYMGMIDSKSLSTKLIDSVTLNPMAQQSVVNKQSYFDEKSGKWTTRYTTNSNGAYDCAKYTLTVNAETVQATDIAALEVFGPQYRDYINFITVNNKESSECKYLIFDETDGKMTWDCKDSKNNNKFMSFTGMIPGETYVDSLKIKNNSYKDFELYMQFVPQEQSTVKDELLSYINMKVFFNEKIMYNGTVEGNTDNENNINFRDVIKLCDIKQKELAEMDIILELDKSVTTDHADLLSEIDCRFMVRELNSPNRNLIEIARNPKTGDKMPIIILSTMLILIICIICLMTFRFKERSPNDQT